MCSAPKPPLCKGRCPEGAEGLSQEIVCFCMGLGRIRYILLYNPSVTAYAVTAPFNKGALRFEITAHINYNLHYYAIASEVIPGI